MQVAQNQALYSLIGNTYGGSGTQTFALPDLRGRVPLGWNPNLSTPTPNTMGQQKGQETATVNLTGVQGSVTLTVNNLPAHSHAAAFAPTGSSTPPTVTANLSVSTAAATTNTPMLASGNTAYLANAAAAAPSSLKGLYTTTAPAAGSAATIPANTTVTGGGGITGGTVTVANTGGGQPAPISFTAAPASVSTIQPSLVLNYIICINGIYPTRS